MHERTVWLAEAGYTDAIQSHFSGGQRFQEMGTMSDLHEILSRYKADLSESLQRLRSGDGAEPEMQVLGELVEDISAELEVLNRVLQQLD